MISFLMTKKFQIKKVLYWIIIISYSICISENLKMEVSNKLFSSDSQGLQYTNQTQQHSASLWPNLHYLYSCIFCQMWPQLCGISLSRWLSNNFRQFSFTFAVFYNTYFSKIYFNTLIVQEKNSILYFNVEHTI